jgi:hypothetical protein
MVLLLNIKPDNDLNAVFIGIKAQKHIQISK